MPASRKYFLVYRMNFDYCLQTKEKSKNNKKRFSCDNFYFPVLNYLELWFNLMITGLSISILRADGKSQAKFFQK